MRHQCCQEKTLAQAALLKSAPFALLRSPARAPEQVWAPQQIPVSPPQCTKNSLEIIPHQTCPWISSTSAMCFSNVWCSPVPVRILYWQYFFMDKGDVRAT
ncbi:hypothetical protein Nmel_017037 [Mimus melanotis]